MSLRAMAVLAIDAAVATLGESFPFGVQPGVAAQLLGGFDRRPADQLGALLGDRSAPHGGVGLAVAGREPAPRRQMGGRGEAVHVTDLGDEDRRE